MYILKDNPNRPTSPMPEELPIQATTVIDARDVPPQFEGANGILTKSPAKLVHSEADRKAISVKQVRGTGGKMGKEWN